MTIQNTHKFQSKKLTDSQYEVILTRTSKLFKEQKDGSREYDDLSIEDQNSARNIIYHYNQEFDKSLDVVRSSNSDEQRQKLEKTLKRSKLKQAIFDVMINTIDGYQPALEIIEKEGSSIKYFNHPAVKEIHDKVITGNSIIDKDLTGIGATTYYMNDRSQSHIIAVPTRAMANNKYSSYEEDPSKYSKDTFYVSVEKWPNPEDRKKALTDFLITNLGEPVSILCVYDSVPWTSNALFEISREHNISNLVRCLNKKGQDPIHQVNMVLVVDELHRILDAGTLMKSAPYTSLLDMIGSNKYRQVIGLTATMPAVKYLPLEFHNFTQVKFKFNKPNTAEVVPCRLESEHHVIAGVYTLALEALTNCTNPNAYFAINSLKHIVSIVNRIVKRDPRSASKIRIVCSDTEENRRQLKKIELPDGGIPFTPSTIDCKTVPARLTFFTSTIFEGADIYDENASLTIVSLVGNDPELNYTMIDPHVQIQQIIGRFRNTKYTRVNFLYNSTSTRLEEFLTHFHLERLVFGRFIKNELLTYTNSANWMKKLVLASREEFIRTGKTNGIYHQAGEEFIRNKYITVYPKGVELNHDGTIQGSNWKQRMSAIITHDSSVDFEVGLSKNAVADRHLAYTMKVIAPYMNHGNLHDYVIDELKSNERLNLRYDDGMKSRIKSSPFYLEMFSKEDNRDIAKFVASLASIKSDETNRATKRLELAIQPETSVVEFSLAANEVINSDTSRAFVESMFYKLNVPPKSGTIIFSHGSSSYLRQLCARLLLKEGVTKLEQKVRSAKRNGTKEEAEKYNEKLVAFREAFRAKFGSRYVNPTRQALIKEATMISFELNQETTEKALSKITTDDGLYYGGVDEFWKSLISSVEHEENIEILPNPDSVTFNLIDCPSFVQLEHKMVHVKGSKGVKRRALSVTPLNGITRRYTSPNDVVLEMPDEEYDSSKVQFRQSYNFLSSVLVDQTIYPGAYRDDDIKSENFCIKLYNIVPKIPTNEYIARLPAFANITPNSWSPLNGASSILFDIQSEHANRLLNPRKRIRLLTNVDYGEDEWYHELDSATLEMFPWLKSRVAKVDRLLSESDSIDVV